MSDDGSSASSGAWPRHYPVEFDVEYPDRGLDRIGTAFRLLLIIPILILLGSLSGVHQIDMDTGVVVSSAGGVLVLPPLLMILFRRKYPRWWFEWNRELLRFSNRVWVYLALLDDQYPSTDEQQAVVLNFPYPDAARLNRWLPLVKWLLAIPHYIVLVLLDIAAVVAVIVAWFVIVFTGRYPRGLFDYVVGVGRWHNRVIGYALILVTDEYPPFRLSP